jgi:pimeloyl-ACP methyl ester carboxylesterase
LYLVSTTCGGIGRTWFRPVEDPSKLKYENKNVDLDSIKKNMSRYFADRFLKNSSLLFEMMCKDMLKNSNKEEIDDRARRQFDVSVNFDKANLLNKISAKKTIIFSGDEDKIIPMQNAVYLNQHIANSKLVLYPEVGHLILIEEPEQFVQDIALSFNGEK